MSDSPDNPAPDTLPGPVWAVGVGGGLRAAPSRRPASARQPPISSLNAPAVARYAISTGMVNNPGLPHGPFIFDRHGVNTQVRAQFPVHFNKDDAGVFRCASTDNHVRRYRHNLRYLDTVMGELVGALKDAGRFDETLLILTADHNWRVDPQFAHFYTEQGLALGQFTALDPMPHELTHVPLIIKRPRQTRPEIITEAFRLVDLQNVIGPAATTLDRTARVGNP